MSQPVGTGVNVLTCPRCTLKAVNLRYLIRHIGIRHSQERNFSITCGIDGCRKFFKLYESFRRHVYRNHRNVISREVGEPTNDVMLPTDCADEVYNAADSVDSSSALSLSDDTEAVCSESDVVNSLGMFCLKLKEQHGASETVVSSVVTDVIHLLKQVHSSHQQQILSELHKTGYDVTSNAELSSLLAKPSSTFEVCEAVLGTSDKRQRFYVDNMPLVLPQQVNIVANDLGKVNVVAFVSVTKVLEKWLSETDILSVIFQSGSSNPAMMRDFFDGELASMYPNRFGNNILQILLYFDDFEVANPLGSKRGVHKMFAVYFTLLNLPIKYRSKLESMHLTLLTKSSTVTKCGLDTVLAPLIDDLKVLQTSGIVVRVNAMTYHLTGQVAFVSADNLGAHQVAGFTQNFSHGRICRFCMATRNEINRLHLESQCKLRTAEIHKAHLSAVLADRTLSSVYGVVRSSPLSCLSDFDVTLSFAPDIMHDLLEGVVPLTIKHVLKAVIATGTETISDINVRMSSMPVKYGTHTYMPQPLTASNVNGDGVIPGNASERWCLLRILPFLLSKVPDENIWETYLNLREICDIVFAKQVPKGFIPYLSVCIANFLQNFQEVFPDIKMTPKMHFLVHYPRYLQLIGPLTSVWTMRFEGKHYPLKEVARRVKNWKNLCMSLARSHQLKQCYSFSAKTICNPDTITSGTRKVKLADLQRGLVAALQQYIDPCETEIWQSNSVTNGTLTVKCKCTYPLRFTNLELPLFFIVLKIFHHNSAVHLCGKCIVINYFDRKRWAYVGRKSGKWEVLHCLETSVDELFLDSHDVVVYEVNGDLLVVPQYGLLCDD